MLIPLAYDQGGSLITVQDAVRGRQYICPDCKGRLMFRNSGLTGPGHRRAHFAHIDDGEHHCTGESVLHAAFKNKAAELFRTLIKDKKSFPVEWRCGVCGASHQGNLLYMASSVEIEHNLGRCQPDVAILDDKGDTVIAFEVVVSHEPTAETLAFYQNHGIVLCRVKLDAQRMEEQLSDIAGTISRSAQISFCNNYQCGNFNENDVHRLLRLSRECPHCHQERQLVYALLESPLGGIANDGLAPEEMEKAKHAIPHGEPLLVQGRFNQYGWGVPCGCSFVRSRRIPSDSYYDPRKGRIVRRRRL